MTEEELIRGCIREEAACQREVFNRYASRMLGVCNRYARNAADAEDILQDALLKFLIRCTSLNLKVRLKAG